MKIANCCLSNFYIDGWNYQENVLSKRNTDDGNEVRILASTETYIDNARLGYVSPSSYFTEHGIPITRLPYKRIINHFVSSKLRAYVGLMRELTEFSPDVIFFHGLAAWALLTVARYKKKYPSVKLYTDSHEDFNNSARTFLSKNILYRLFYCTVLKKAYPQIDKIFYISLETKDFINQLYGLPDDKLEFYPLGGIIFDEDMRNNAKQKIREELKLSPEDVLFVHSGKLDKLKRTEELLRAFSAVQSPSLKLIIIGSIPDDMKQILLPLIEADNRVEFIGWKSSNELLEYLCACDLYLQPGSQSATMQNAICCGAPVMLYPHKSHMSYLDGNGWFVKTVEDMIRVFETIKGKKGILAQMSQNSQKVACELIDYKVLAERLYK